MLMEEAGMAAERFDVYQKFSQTKGRLGLPEYLSEREKEHAPDEHGEAPEETMGHLDLLDKHGEPLRHKTQLTQSQHV